MSYMSFLVDRCTIFRYNEVTEGNVTSEDLVEIAADVPCRKIMKSTRNIVQDGRNKVVGTHLLHLMKTTDIKNGDVVVVNGGPKLKVTDPNLVARHHIEAILNEEDEL